MTSEAQAESRGPEKLARGMQDAITRGHMDYFATLACRRGKLLCQLASPAYLRSGKAARPPLPDEVKVMFRQALNDNRMLIELLRHSMAETLEKIKLLRRQQQAVQKLAGGYGSAHTATGGYVSARI